MLSPLHGLPHFSLHSLNKQVLLSYGFYKISKTGLLGFDNLSKIMTLVSKGLGKLTLNPTFKLPPYMTSIKHEDDAIESVSVRQTCKKTGGRHEQPCCWVIQV